MGAHFSLGVHEKNLTQKFGCQHPMQEETQLEGEATLLSFLWYKNDASTKKEALSVEFPLTCDLYGCYIISPPLLC
jgi:hypothetical protein